MNSLVLQHCPETFRGPCGLCGKATALPAGLQICQAEEGLPVCSPCGRRAAPELAALLGLAGAAQDVGLVNRHTVVPPLTALMKLARAAECYTSIACPAPTSGRLAA